MPTATSPATARDRSLFIILGHLLQVLRAASEVVLATLLIGISALIAAFQGEGWGVGIFGAFSLILGLALMFNAVVGGAVLIWLSALLLVIQGAVGVFWSFSKR